MKNKKDIMMKVVRNSITKIAEKKAYANFWLAKDSDRSVVSNIYQFMYKSGDHYCKAHSAANQTYVRLGAENANYTLSESATIKGFWDEETW